jgi:hypothetical protein
LTAKNPHKHQNIIRFDNRTGEFVDIKQTVRMISHLNIKSTSVPKNSEEGKTQQENAEGSKFNNDV